MSRSESAIAASSLGASSSRLANSASRAPIWSTGKTRSTMPVAIAACSRPASLLSQIVRPADLLDALHSEYALVGSAREYDGGARSIRGLRRQSGTSDRARLDRASHRSGSTWARSRPDDREARCTRARFRADSTRGARSPGAGSCREGSRPGAERRCTRRRSTILPSVAARPGWSRSRPDRGLRSPPTCPAPAPSRATST